jgi:organic hydroperoxide reductase OsmC/OhrA
METKSPHKSFRFKNSLVWGGGLRGRTSAPGKPEMEVGSPTEFKGDPGIWSPEELLICALNACLMLTFVSWSKNKNVQVADYESRAEGLLENVDGKYRITGVNVQPSIVLKSETNIEAARAIMAEVERNCFISNSIRAKVTVAAHFRIAG